MRIDRNSYGTLALVFLLSALVVLCLFLFTSVAWLQWSVTGFLLVFCVWQLSFFRVPRRKQKGSGKVVTSAADGKVVIIDRFFEQEFLQRECLRICVYMNFFDVHANFWPVSGEVTYHRYHPGKHLLAFKPKASEENEHTTTCIRTPDGRDVLFRQHAGTFARRIVNYAKPGMQVKAGAQCGIIKFGSRMDVFLPLNAEIKVSLGDLTVACETILATL